MLKKMGVVTVGVAAGLMVAAPFASAPSRATTATASTTASPRTATSPAARRRPTAASTATRSSATPSCRPRSAAPTSLNVVCNDILNGNLSGNNVAVSVLGEEAALPTPDSDLGDVPVNGDFDVL